MRFAFILICEENNNFFLDIFFLTGQSPDLKSHFVMTLGGELFLWLQQNVIGQIQSIGKASISLHILELAYSHSKISSPLSHNTWVGEG